MSSLHIVLFFLLLVPMPQIFAEELQLGGKEGWDDFPLRDGVISRRLDGQESAEFLSLEKYGAQKTEFTELLLGFDGPMSLDHYAILNMPRLSREARTGSHSARFTGDQAMEIAALPGSLFYEGGNLHDFTIEFWYYPLALSGGGDIFYWYSPQSNGRSSQELRVFVENHRLIWDFQGIFFDNQEPQDIAITGTMPLVPHRWQHHRLRYFHRQEQLVYSVDGEEVAIHFTTDSGRQTGQRRYFPHLFSHSRIVMGTRLSGLLDDVHISRQAEDRVSVPSQYREGSAISRVFDLQNLYATVESLEFLGDVPPRGNMRLSYRISNTLTSLSPEQAIAEEWTLLSDDGQINEQGRFVQYRVELYPDPFLDSSPELYTMRTQYRLPLPLPPPTNVQAVAGDGQAVLSWEPVNIPGLAGYRIYGGTSPSLASFDMPLDLPVDVGMEHSWQIEGLENGKGYFFSIAAYRDATYYRDELRTTPVFVRPLSR